MGNKKMSLTTKILIGLGLGIVVGLAFPGQLEFLTTYIQPFGKLFISLIKMVIVPLVFASLVVGAASIGDVRSLGRIGGKTIAYYLMTTAFAVFIGLILGTIIQPGKGLSIPAGATAEAKVAPPLMDVLVGLIPTNAVQAMVDANMLQIIIFALFVGVAAALIKEKGKPFIGAIDSLAEIMYKITGIIMEVAPYGVFALIAPVVAANGPAVLLPFAKVIFAVYFGCAFHALLVYSSAVSIFAKMNPLKYFKGIAPAAITAFTTTSSSATLPVTIKSTMSLGVPENICSFCLPLGATINMDGTALYQGVCALFVAQVFGIHLTMAQMGTIIVTATLASIGTAGVPGAGLIMLSMVLQSVGLPLEGVVLVAGIDRILDMARTCVNVVGDTSCAVIVAATEKVLAVTDSKKSVSGQLSQ